MGLMWFTNMENRFPRLTHGIRRYRQEITFHWTENGDLRSTRKTRGCQKGGTSCPTTTQYGIWRKCPAVGTCTTPLASEHMMAAITVWEARFKTDMPGTERM